MPRRIVLLFAILIGCSDQGPIAYHIGGTWEGSSVGEGFLRLELSHTDDLVGGSGHWTTQGKRQNFTLNRTNGTPTGHLRDSSLFAFATMLPDGINTVCEGNLQGVYRIEEARAGRFVARFSCGTFSYNAPVRRR